MKKGQYLVLIVCQLLIVSVSLVCGLYIGSLRLIKDHTNVVYHNITIENIDVGGKDYDEAVRYIEETYVNPILSQEVTIAKGEEVVTMIMEDFYKPVDIQVLLQDIAVDTNALNKREKLQLLAGQQTKDYDLLLEVDDSRVKDLAKKISTAINKESIEATIFIDEASNIQITPHQVQGEFNEQSFIVAVVDGLKEQKSFQLVVEDFVVETNPARTAETLGQIDTCIASYSTKVYGGDERETNVRLASEAINGIVLLPGDIFSFNDIVGDSTEEKGYKAAPVIVNKQMEMGLGGGVCQVSSTLYNAVLRTGLGSVRRQPHSIPLSYVPKGLDATISYDIIDYQFQNTFDYPIYIQSFLKDQNVYVHIYGNQALKGPVYELKTETYEVIASPVKYIKDATLPEGQKVLTQKGRQGYKVKVMREKYEEGKRVSTEVISKDTYKPSTTYYKIGTKKVSK
ncbi:MAG: VanW family protein [Cellulosilyticaceae bacterium]